MVRRLIVGSASLVAVLSLVTCGGSSSNPTSPSGTTPPAGVTISIRSTSNAQSFDPNPASINSGQTVAWRNNDSATHRIVGNDGSFDTGVIAPGATSAGIALPGGTNYHCTIHTAMVGAIGVAAEPPPPCTGQYC